MNAYKNIIEILTQLLECYANKVDEIRERLSNAETKKEMEELTREYWRYDDYYDAINHAIDFIELKMGYWEAENEKN